MGPPEVISDSVPVHYVNAAGVERIWVLAASMINRFRIEDLEQPSGGRNRPEEYQSRQCLTPISERIKDMPTITTKGGTEIFYKDWGTGRPIVFSHG